jgi:hypothetical protein
MLRRRRSQDAAAKQARKPLEPQEAILQADPGWHVSDSPNRIFTISVENMMSGIEAINRGPGSSSIEEIVSHLVKADIGFGWLAKLGFEVDLVTRLQTACADLWNGLSQRDGERTNRGYGAVRQIVQQIGDRAVPGA